MNLQPITHKDVPNPDFQERVPYRPLPRISDYVTMELPEIIREIQSGQRNVSHLEERAEGLCDAVAVSDTLAATAHLDAYMLRTAIVKQGGTPGPKLEAVSAALSDALDMMPVLTYEDLIKANPLQKDPRTFTGTSEVFFYRVHVEIERVAAETISHMRRLLDNDASPESIAIDSDKEVAPCIEYIKRQMHQLAQDLSDDQFSAMRTYFTTDEQSRLKGPSGNFSAGIFAIDSLLLGDHPDMIAFQDAKMSDLKYFPRTTVQHDAFAGRHDMIASHAHGLRGATFNQRLRGRGEMPNSVLGRLFSKMHDMRRIHLGIGMRYIVKPLVAEGKMSEADVRGSAKSRLVEYLQRARDIYQNAIPSDS